MEGFLDKLGDDRAEGGVTRGHEDGPPALVHQAVHRSVESLVYRQRKIQMESTAVWFGSECFYCFAPVLWIRNGFNADPDPDPDPGFWGPKIGKKIYSRKKN